MLTPDRRRSQTSRCFNVPSALALEISANLLRTILDVPRAFSA